MGGLLPRGQRTPEGASEKNNSARVGSGRQPVFARHENMSIKPCRRQW